MKHGREMTPDVVCVDAVLRDAAGSVNADVAVRELHSFRPAASSARVVHLAG